MDRREREALDDHITGHGGEDQFRYDGPEDEIQRLTASLREANLAQRELIARMRAAVQAEQLGGRGMDWVEGVVDAAGLWPAIDGPDALDLFNAEMDEQRRLRQEWAEA